MTNDKAQSSNECQNLNVKWMICNLTFGICNLALHFDICHVQVMLMLISTALAEWVISPTEI